MSSSALRRIVFVLALGALLGAPAASLAGPYPGARRTEDRIANVSPMSRLWNALSRFWEKEGCSGDPYGRCLTQAQPKPGAGCLLGLNGPCRASTPGL